MANRHGLQEVKKRLQWAQIRPIDWGERNEELESRLRFGISIGLTAPERDDLLELIDRYVSLDANH